MKRSMVCLLFGVFLLTGCSGESSRLAVSPVSDELPAPEGLSWWSRAAMDAYIRFSSWSGGRSGFIVMFARDGVPIYSNAAGWKDIASSEPMTVDTHVRIASMTKPITAVTAMTLVEEGRLGLDDLVSDYLPEFSQMRVAERQTPEADGSYASHPSTNPLRIRHLLMFASGIGPGMNKDSELVQYWDDNGIYKQEAGGLRERVAQLAALPLFEEPGERWRYGFSADVLAAVVEVVTGQKIAELMRERVFDPLGMHDTRHEILPEDREQLATVYSQNEEGELIEMPPRYDTDWNAGGGGLVSTADDYMRFALMLWNGGEYRGTRILQQATIDEMTRPHVPDGVLADVGIEGLGWGLGMAVVADEERTVTPDRDGDFWWSGYFGTTFLVSPETGLVAVVYTQNEPGEFSGLPYQVYILQGIALAGM
jgi:CubicO group peptidase (beta-lactamase class C family)